MKRIRKPLRRKRRGVTTIDYILILGLVIPLVAFMFGIVPRMIRLVYEMTIVVVNSPVG